MKHDYVTCEIRGVFFVKIMLQCIHRTRQFDRDIYINLLILNLF